MKKLLVPLLLLQVLGMGYLIYAKTTINDEPEDLLIHSQTTEAEVSARVAEVQSLDALRNEVVTMHSTLSELEQTQYEFAEWTIDTLNLAIVLLLVYVHRG